MKVSKKGGRLLQRQRKKGRQGKWVFCLEVVREKEGQWVRGFYVSDLLWKKVGKKEEEQGIVGCFREQETKKHGKQRGGENLQILYFRGSKELGASGFAKEK
ncbi:hypothetical protein SLEP1_g47458 [Rubroshorea leprosula]|uniref:Uncharacterized protein n=1 Tax=Rubroshorea leprosula TaxID=152421 RepID=A0AAV5LTC6_9ROSI|nr:hypothetical protein SLEP1_g47458 [Rubroshorea leprosula]